jgi:hypothetical protein
MTSRTIILVMLLATIVNAFVPDTFGRLASLRLYAEEEVAWESAFPSAQVIEVSLPEHKPLGCTVEESLGDTVLKPVFVSKVSKVHVFIYDDESVSLIQIFDAADYSGGLCRQGRYQGR